jgi:hypothetical protein
MDESFLLRKREGRRLVHANNFGGVNKTNAGIVGMVAEQRAQYFLLTDQDEIG